MTEAQIAFIKGVRVGATNGFKIGRLTDKSFEDFQKWLDENYPVQQ